VSVLPTYCNRDRVSSTRELLLLLALGLFKASPPLPSLVGVRLTDRALQPSISQKRTRPPPRRHTRLQELTGLRRANDASSRQIGVYYYWGDTEARKQGMHSVSPQLPWLHQFCQKCSRSAFLLHKFRSLSVSVILYLSTVFH
jgi:hypothetical protein